VDDALHELIESRAIEQLMIRYIDRIDANDPAGAADCFTEDGVGIYWGEYRGRAAIAQRLAGILDRFAHTSHHLSNVAVTIDGDRAASQAYVYAFHRTRDSNDFLHYWGRWVDELHKVDGEWQFARREVVGIGSYTAGDGEKERRFPGHPGRLTR
jgi:uncharacterized protein (TIGR02246 family)